MGVRLVKYGVVANGSGAGTYDHSDLENRDLPDQHPIGSISGLQAALEALKSHDNLTDRDLPDQHPIEAITGLQEALDNLNINVDDTRTVDLNYEDSTLTANVKLFPSDDNAILEKTTGLFVDKYVDVEIQDTESIHLTMEGKGDTLLDMYNSGNVFSHYGGTNNIYSKSEANAWYFDEDLGSFVQPLNTITFTGFVSNVKYRTYTHRATFRSSSTDNDANGLVIGYILDNNNNPRTLSCIINKARESHCGSFYYAIVYNRNLNGQVIVKTGTIPNNSTSGWSNHYITMEVSKAGNYITCNISTWDSLEVLDSTLLEIDLNDYAWGSYFTDRVQYGYCNQSQASSYFTDIYFNGKGPLTAHAILSPDEGNILEIRANGLYATTNTISEDNRIKITQQSHGFSIGDILYCDTDGIFKKALAEDTIKIEVVGIVSGLVSNNDFYLTVSGLIQGVGNTFNNGDVLYLSDTSEGEFTITPTMNILKPLAIKIPDGIIVNIQRASHRIVV